MTAIPHATEPFLDGDGRINRSWRAYLTTLTRIETLAKLQEQIDALTTAQKANLQGVGSIDVSGLLSNGLAVLSLVGDEESPGASHYYGTDESGNKGWQDNHAFVMSRLSLRF